jgi:hypothetical protein
VKATFVNDPFPHVLVSEVFPQELLPSINRDLIASRQQYMTQISLALLAGQTVVL